MQYHILLVSQVVRFNLSFHCEFYALSNALVMCRHKLTVEESSGKCSLSIFAAQHGDEGQYTCTARNPAGVHSTVATVFPGGECSPIQ